jgi:hypothetical protein
MGFMPVNRRVKYLRKCIEKYIDVGRASCPGMGGLNIYITCIVKYIYVEGALCLRIGGLNIYVSVL